MDPLSALTVAASVVQFVDFGSRLLRDTYRAYKSPSGQTSQNIELSKIAKDLASLSSQVQTKSDQIGQTNTGTGSSEETLLRLCRECREVSTELESALSQLIARGTTKLDYAKASFVVAMRGIWKEGKVKELSEHLNQIRQQMTIAALVCLWEDTKQGSLDNLQLLKVQAEILKALEQIDDSTRNFSQELKQLSAIGSFRAAQDRRKLMDSTVNAEWKLAADIDPPSNDPMEKELKIGKWKETIIDSLLFGTTFDREETIPARYRRTFEWIFKAPSKTSDERNQWSSFPTWLEKDSKEIYWVTGKPGSGKSTLMKFLLRESRVQQHLRTWAGSLPLVFASFYFWNAGTDMQKSHEGLMRTLLHRCLEHTPDLVPLVCPKRWFLLKHYGTEELPETWGWDELVECFNSLLLLGRSQFKLAFFIDGLDEFDGDHGKLVSFIADIKSCDGVKVCVSSRPWNIFVDAFKQNPSLVLEVLSLPDITAFVEGNFEDNQGFQELKQFFPKDAEQLLDDIITKAQGVWLWVSLVVRILLENLLEGDQLSLLQATLKELPSDLSKLFQNIWDNLRPKSLSDSSQYFQIIEAEIDKLSAVSLWLADDEQLLEGGHSSMISSKVGVLDVVKIMKRRLNSRTRGLLEVNTAGNINYLHRTARDWILMEDTWKQVCSKAPADFDPYLVLVKERTIRRSYLPEKQLGKSFWHSVQITMWYAAHVKDSPLTTSRFVEVLDKFDKEAAKNNPRQPSHWSVTQGLRLPNNSFVGFAAQCNIIPYVRAKVSADSSLLREEPPVISILENAIFGPCHFVHGEGDWEMWNSLFEEDRRLELVKFLLEAGASRSQASHDRRLLSDLALRLSEESDYWKVMTGLFVIRIIEPVKQAGPIAVQPVQPRSSPEKGFLFRIRRLL